MAGKEMQGDNRQRRKAAREAREQGSLPSEVGASGSAAQQRTKARDSMSHQERLDPEREGKQDQIRQNTPAARPGSRDADSPDRETYPRR